MVECPETCKTLACNDVQDDVRKHISPLNSWLNQKMTLHLERIVLAMICNLLKQYQEMDPIIAFLPCHKTDATSLSLPEESHGMILIESGTF